MAWTVFLGSNEIRNCDGVLIVEGEEVFRMRERTHDGQLVVDFDLRDASGDRLAKISKNHVVHAAEGFEPRSRPGLYELVHSRSGHVLARVEELSPGTIRITGDFWVNGFHVFIDDSVLKAGPITFARNTVTGFAKAIEFRRDAIGIGVGKAH